MKNLPRICALLLAVIMLLSMAPVALADNPFCEGDCTPGTWYWDRPGTCVEQGIQNCICAVCGNVFTEREVYGDHQWGSWRTTKAPTCTAAGQESRTCQLCGKVENRDLPMIGHQWGLWWHQSLPTCTEGGFDSRRCDRCDAKEHSPVPATGHSFGEWYVVTAPTLDLPGLEERMCEFCSLTEQREIPKLDINDPSIPPDEILKWVFSVDVIVLNLPRNGQFYVEGEQVMFQVQLNMKSGFETVIDVVAPTLRLNYQEIPLDPVNDMYYSVSLPPYEYYVTAEDVAQGAVYYSAHAELFSDLRFPFSSQEKHILCDEEPVGYYLDKQIVNPPHNGSFYVPGEEIVYQITFTNASPIDCHNVVIHDALISGSAPLTTLDFLGCCDSSTTLTASYVVTDDDAQRQKVENVAGVTWYNPERMHDFTLQSNKVVAPCGVGSLKDATLSIFCANTPANGKYFTLGETVLFDVAYSNNCAEPMRNVVVHAAKFNSSGSASGFTQPQAQAAIALHSTLEAPARNHASYSYTVTEEDIRRGIIHAASKMESESADTLYSVAPSVACGDGRALTLLKTVTSTPANGLFYQPGETIAYSLSTVNTGEDPCYTVKLYDPLYPKTNEYDVFNPGAFSELTYTYTVTEADAFAGFVRNVANANYRDMQGRYHNQRSNEVYSLCGFNPDDLPAILDGALLIGKREVSTPQNGQYYQLGETIVYHINYANNSPIPLTDVTVRDSLTRDVVFAHEDQMAPGQSITREYRHVVTAEDVANGYVLNFAYATFDCSGSYRSVTSPTVCCDTDGVPDLTATLPAMPEYTPGGSWVTPIAPAEDSKPVFGVIDTTSLCNARPNHCVRTVTGRSSTSISYETAYCAAHSTVHASSLMMSQAAATPEIQQQAAAYATALWRAETEKLYEEIYAAADPQAQAVVMTEYVRFLTSLANYETLLHALYPDQPAQVAQMVADMWQEQCVNLCYDAHAGAANRKDSLLSVSVDASGSDAACTCATIAEENAKRAYRQTFCPMHVFPLSMIDVMAKDQNTPEAWAMVRQLWGVELSNTYAKVGTLLGDSKDLALSEYAAMTQWMQAREASLIALYPENPELVAQLMVQFIINRVNALCPALP